MRLFKRKREDYPLVEELMALRTEYLQKGEPTSYVDDMLLYADIGKDRKRLRRDHEAGAAFVRRTREHMERWSELFS